MGRDVDSAKDYYLILEVHPKASVEMIDRAKRVLLLRYHPDHNVDETARAAERTRLVIEAHGVLSDPERRAAYDASRADGAEKKRAEAAPTADSRTPPPEDTSPSGPRARARQFRPHRPKAERTRTHSGVRAVMCRACGASSQVRAELSPRDVTCGACGNPLRPRFGPRVRNALARIDDVLERARARVLGLLPGRSGSVRPRRREKSS
ncbi:hypothetical protein CMK11_09645 [Candidatus Poribacteria bacterium]|nr:hypothetical protein [Candidatus Poribacteria bacterium]